MSIDVLGRPTRSGTTRPQRPRRRDRRAALGVGLAAVLAAVAWLPFLTVPLSPDESGFLLLAQHWSPGSSMYGDYWVDRPPLLLWLFLLAGHLWPVSHPATGLAAPGVKLLGASASGVTVALAGVLARQVAPTRRRAVALVVVAAVALTASPLLGMPETNGELLSLPFVLGGITSLVAAARRSWGRDAALLTAVAGASGTCAVLVKQNVVDVFVLAVVLLVLSRRRGAHLRWRLATFAAAAAGVLAAALAAAARLGTSPAALWDATVVFRLQASAVIRASASDATSGRMSVLALAALGSGVAVVLVLAAIATVSGSSARRTVPRDDLRPALAWAALALAAWELCGVVAGGSYWLHYLTGLLPGTLLLLALAAGGSSRRWRAVLTGCVAYLVLASAAVWGQHVVAPAPVSDDARVVAYLRANAQHGDGVVTAFGHPDIVAGSGLSSPYEHLWSLPVRVRDPQLSELAGVLRGPDAPGWVVVAGDSLDSWGLDATATQRVFDRHYAHRVTFGEWQVWQRRGGSPGQVSP